MTVVLFVRADSVYKRLGADCYDIERDATNFQWDRPAICHPPCRAWGNFRWNAKPRPGEKEMALWCLDGVRRVGGIVEHPRTSTLWQHLLPGDRWLDINQGDFGHRAQKATRLFYNLDAAHPPLPPPWLGGYTPVEYMGVKEREETPPYLAKWLLQWLQK